MERAKTKKRKVQPKPKAREFDIEDDEAITLSEAEEMEAMEAIGDNGAILNYLRFRRANLQRRIIHYSHYKYIFIPQYQMMVAAAQGRLELVDQLIKKADMAYKTKQKK